jgi:hypothetical protein
MALIINSTPSEDSEHVMAATNVRRGATPAVWKDGQPDGYAGKWDSVVPGGPADMTDGDVDAEYHNHHPWTQI